MLYAHCLPPPLPPQVMLITAEKTQNCAENETEFLMLRNYSKKNNNNLTMHICRKNKNKKHFSGSNNQKFSKEF